MRGELGPEIRRAAFRLHFHGVLRSEAGVSPECDRTGLGLIVTAGEAAKHWGVEPGSSVMLVRWMDGSVALQESLMVGDTWFGNATGVGQRPSGECE